MSKRKGRGLLNGCKVVILAAATLLAASCTLFTSTPSPTPDFGAPMALVPAGPFMMGSEDGDNDERPVHEVYLDAFYIDIYEVTNALYKKCVDVGVCDPPYDLSSYTRQSYYGNLEYADYPVIDVDWDMARTYCEWRGARLPTEAEWEKAARGGLEGAQYPWGDEAPVCQEGAPNGANLIGCAAGDTMPVGSYSPNGYELYDMAGNVWEWVADWYLEDYYATSPSENPLGPESGDYRVVRGGSWIIDERYLRSAIREWFSLENWDVNLGFRCARSP